MFHNVSYIPSVDVAIPISFATSARLLFPLRLANLRGNKSLAEVAKDIGIATSTLGMYETLWNI